MKRTLSRQTFGFGKKDKKNNSLLTPQLGGAFTSGTLDEVVEHLCECMGSLKGRSEAGMFLSAFFAMVSFLFMIFLPLLSFFDVRVHQDSFLPISSLFFKRWNPLIFLNV